MPAPEGVMHRLTFVFLSLLGLLAGCAVGASPVPQHDPNQLRWGVVGLSDVPTLDPALAADPTSISVTSMVFGGLVRLDHHLKVRPDGADHWNISPDGTVYTFHLRPGLRFADGRKVTASDFASSLERALGPERSVGTAQFYLRLLKGSATGAAGSAHPIAGITVVDSRTLQLTLDRPAAHFLAELAFPASYVVEATQIQQGQNWMDHASGFGPYMVQAWRHGRYLSLVPNPHYYGGRPTLSKITFRFYQDPRTALALYQGGKLDLVSGWPAGNAIPGHLSGLRRVPALAQDYLAFNTTGLPFHRINARRALASAWTNPAAGGAIQATTFPALNWLPSAFGILLPTHPFKRTGATFMSRAGYPAGKRFPRVTLVLPRNPEVFALASAMSRRWRDSLGIDVALRQLNLSDYQQILQKRAFDLAIVRWGADYPDPQDYLGTQLGPSSENITGWSSHAYADAILLADSYDPTDSRRQELYQEAGRLAARKLPLLPLDEPAQTALIAPGVRAVTLTALGTVVGDWRRVHFVQ
jgi:oligopeptide transport system substrate-binding protein